MNGGISEITLDKLNAFARRRRLLIAMRGFCVGIVALLVVMGVIAVVDFFFVIKSQPLRWSLSLTGYALVALTVWAASLRSLLRVPGPRELARLVERAAPGLREDLLSAVELGSAQTDPRHDSPQFRSLLQSSVEDRMSRVRIAAVLPGGLIRGVALLAFAVLTGCVVLLLIPDLQFASRLARAFLPSAPIDRVARVRVKILAPNPADALCPHNDAVNVIIELGGEETDDVVVETRRTEQGREEERIALKPAGGTRRFSGMIQLGQEPVKYRVLAGDAVTRTYTIATGARPHAIAFGKTYRYPDYAGMASKMETARHGSLQAVEGTKVELAIDVDQPVSAGELRFDDAAGHAPPIALSRISDTRWRAVVPIGATMNYKVHLTAAATGFDNAFDPAYEIIATPDRPPVLTVESPAKDALSRQGEAIDVRVSASDDLGLGAIRQSYRINGGAWIDIALADNPGRQWSIARGWELYDLNLRPGDQVATRFAAADRAGHKVESTPVVITIAAAGFDRNRLAGLEGKRRVLAALVSLQASADGAAQSFAGKDGGQADTGALQIRQSVLNAIGASQKLRDDADAVLAVVRGAMRSNQSGSDADDLVQAGLAVSWLRDQAAGTTRAAIEAAAAKKDVAVEREALVGAGDTLSAAAKLVQVARQRFARIVAADEADALLRDLLQLRREQQAMAPGKQPDEPSAWQRLARRQLLLAAQSKEAQVLAESSGRGNEFDPMLGAVAKTIGGPIAEVEAILTREQSKQTVLAADQKMNQALDAAIKEALPRSRSASAAMLLHLSMDLRLHQSLDVLIEGHGAIRDTSSLAESPQWAAVPALLRIGGALHEARADADSDFVADIGLVRRAIGALQRRVGGESDGQVSDRLASVRLAFEVLEAGHGVAELHTAALAQASLEKWLRSESDAVTRHPRQWQWTRQRLAGAAEALGKAGLPGAAQAVAGIAPGSAAQILDVEMASRRMKGRVSKTRAEQFEQVAARLAGVKALIAPDMAKARAAIAVLGPTLSEQMAALAAEAKNLESRAADASAKVDRPKTDVPGDTARQLQHSQSILDAGLDDLAEALRHDANKQDAFTRDGRERARDSDDAVAMLREPAEKATRALAEAADASQADEQRDRLRDAAAQESRLASALEKLAEHYKNLDEGDGERTRAALRQAERELGVKREMDAEFGRMERLAALSGQLPDEQLAELERELKQNPAMKAELSDLARQAAAGAKASLDDAAARERAIAQDLAAAQESLQQAKPDMSEPIKEIARQAAVLAGKTPSIAEQAQKGTAGDAAKAAREAGAALQKAGQASPPGDAKGHVAAAKQADALAQALRQATDKLKETQSHAMAAAQRVRDEESEATTKLAVGSVSDEERVKAADTMLHAKNREAAAKRAAVEARDAAKKAESLAAEAGKIAKELGEAASTGDKAIAEASRAQPAIAQGVRKAAEDVARAQRHEERMEGAAAAQSLAQAKAGIDGDASMQVGKSAAALAQAKQPGEAQPAVKGAESAISAQAEKLEQVLKRDEPARKGDPVGEAPQGSADGASRDEHAAKWMARALDELDRAASEEAGSARAMAQAGAPTNKPGEGGAPGQGANQPGESGDPGAEGAGRQPGGSPSSSSAASATRAVREAALAQAGAMARARQGPGSDEPGAPEASGHAMASNQKAGEPSGSSKGGPGSSPGGQGNKGGAEKAPGGKGRPGASEGRGGSGSGSEAPSRATADLPDLEAIRRGEWGKLPARLARELMEGQRDEVPSEYRGQVEAYFRAISQKAKQK
jgi:hypothetical protein